MPTACIDGLRIGYTDTGSGLPVVFAPSLTGSKEWFHYQSLGLSDHYRIISYDVRRARGRGPYSLDMLADDLARFLSALRIGAAGVVGHGFGGLVALKFAFLHPERAPALILSSTAPTFAGTSDEDLLALLCPTQVGFESVWQRLWKLVRPPRTVPEDDTDPVAYLARHNGEVDAATVAARLRILRESDLTPVLPEIAAPSLIIAGADDSPRVLAGSQLMDQRLPESTLEVIEGAGHFCFFTRHDLFNATVVDFLNRACAHL